ncbi:MAG: DUF2891 domain-containing protein [Janthinobacterium lividum]
MKMTPEIAARFARIALGHVAHAYPHKADHVANSAADMSSHTELHPVFFGSFDWHSCVHGWWLLFRLRAAYPGLAASIDPLAATTFTAAKLAVELAYLDRANSGGFERPYGWAWLLALHGAAADTEWGPLLDPLARAFAARFAAFLPKATYPIRTGSHANTAFACVLAHDWAAAHDPALATLIAGRVTGWYGGDRDAQAWEPDGDAFLSPVLCEALAMSRVLPGAEFTAWFDAFLPRAAARDPAALFTPAVPSDRSDGKIAHLDGLNFSRAWCWRQIAAKLSSSHPLYAVAESTAGAHIAASIDHVAGDYAGEHWLATFAFLALTSPPALT